MKSQFYLVNVETLTIVAQSNEINNLIELRKSKPNTEIANLDTNSYLEFYKGKWFYNEGFICSIEVMYKWFFIKYYQLKGSELVMVENDCKETQKLEKQAYKFIEGKYIEINNMFIQ
jgi:hypothetical protein